MTSDAAEQAVDILREKRIIAIIGERGGARDKLVREILSISSKTFPRLAVLDWCGAYDLEGIYNVDPRLPFNVVSKYLPLAVSSMYGLNGSRVRLEGLAAEAVAVSRSFEQFISYFERSSYLLARSLTHRLSPLERYFTEKLNSLPYAFRIDLSRVPILLRRTVLQLWIAYFYEELKEGNFLFVISEASNAVKRGWWVWYLIDDFRNRNSATLLIDEQLLRAYLRYPIIFTSFRLEEVYNAYRYKIHALAKEGEKGNAVIIKDANEIFSRKVKQR